MAGATIAFSPKVVIFDLGDVLFSWSSKTTTTLPSKLLREFLSSNVWKRYECGKIGQDACYQQIAQDFAVPALEVAEAFRQARESLQPNAELLSLLRSLKEGIRARIFAMSNISKEDYAALSEKFDFSIFDRVFISGAAGMRKPNTNFFQHVMQEIGLNPSETLFIDDKPENVQAAQALGVNGLVFDDTAVGKLRDLIEDPISKAYKYLHNNARRFDSVTDSGVVISDNFAQLLILDATGKKELVNLDWENNKTWNFFRGKAVLVPGGYFPDDLDTTSLALTVLRSQPAEVTSSVLDRMAHFVNSDGSVQTYFNRNKPRTDAVVSANVLSCFYTHGRGHQLEPTLQYVRKILSDRSYLQGTRYYPSPDCCLGFFSRLLQSSSDSHLHSTLGSLMRLRVQERVGKQGNALDLAMRIIACKSLHVACDDDHQSLRNLQWDDGGWESGWIYRYGSTGVRFGNRGVTTALAIKALGATEYGPRSLL